MTPGHTWQTFERAVPERGRPFFILRRGAWREPRLITDREQMLEYEQRWKLEWRYATAAEIEARV